MFNKIMTEIDTTFSYIIDNTTREIVREGYESVMRIGIEHIFINNDITEELITTNNMFMTLCNDIENHGGTAHSGASFGFLCGQLSLLFKNPEEHRRRHLNVNNHREMFFDI